jgi:hypothetical protein
MVNDSFLQLLLFLDREHKSEGGPEDDTYRMIKANTYNNKYTVNQC